jgi:hypothetical protein
MEPELEWLEPTVPREIETGAEIAKTQAEKDIRF